MKKPLKTTLGGKRLNAGRKAIHGERKQSLTVRVTPTLRAFLESRDESLSESIEGILSRSPEFIQWRKTKAV